MRKYIIVLIGFVFNLNSFGQEMPKIIPPSPEAVSVFKFTEVPVSLYTGLPNIDIPLFEIESGGVKLPISISYHARGIQVAEIASRVGLGWTLNAGGIISKQVRDKDDSLGLGSCVNYSTFFTEQSSRSSTYAYQTPPLSDNCDMIPDQYTFSVNGMNGKFMWDTTGGGWVTQKYSNIKVSPGQIIDGEGNEYLFGENNFFDTDISLKNYVVRPNNHIESDGNSNYLPNTWHLTKIKTANGSVISFNYSMETSSYYKRIYDKLFNSAPFNESHVTLTRSHQQRIERIFFDQGEIEFEYSETNREDMPGTSFLKKILLKDKAGNIVKQAIFSYEYTVGTDLNMNTLLTGDVAARKRLFLKSVQIADKDNTTLPPYFFEYDVTVLPSRHSNSVDVWGYFNGKNNGSFLEIASDDRTVDTLNVQAGMLKSIIKPEGGKIDFYYEPNTAVNVFPESVWFGDANPSIQKSAYLTTIVATATENNIDVDTGLPYYEGAGTYSDVFTISDFRKGPITYSAYGLGIDNCRCDGNMYGCPEEVSPNASCLFRFFIEKWNPDNGQFVYLFGLSPGTRTISLQPGTYRLKVHYNVAYPPHTLTDTNQFFSVYISWNEEIVSIVPNEIICQAENMNGNKVVYAAGNRIKKIEYKNADDSIALTKTYRYTDSNGYNSGRVLGLTNFVAVNKISVNGQPATIFEPFGSGSGSLFSTYQSNAVGYKYVTEYYGDGANTIGKTDYSYTMIYDTGKYYEFPYHPPTDNEWLRGKELSVTHYKKVGDDYHVVQKKENTYLFADELEYTGFEGLCNHPFLKPSVITSVDQNRSDVYLKNRKCFSIPLIIIPVNASILEGTYSYKTYYMTGGTMDLKKTKVTDYLGGNEVVTTTDYGYNYDRHYNLSYSQQTSSDGSVRLNRYLYAQSLELENDAITAALIAKNMVGTPIQKEVRESIAVKLSTEKTIFKDWGNGIVAPEIVQTSKGNTAALENRVKYNKYDDKGNLLEVQKENGTKISYIYGYNQALPVAKIENIGYDQIPIQAIEAIHNNTAISSSNNGSTAPDALNNLRAFLVSFPNAMITTFTYKPLVGVTSLTDPRGQTTTYEYDGFGRLERVKDHQGNILSENEYHYRTQN